MSPKHLTMLKLSAAKPVTPKPTDRASVEIYRPFFIAGIVCVLTVGCLLGAIALHGIGRSGTYTSAAWTPYILAHANSQLYGWVGLFVMGFSLQQHAPTLARAKLFHQLAYASLSLLAAGIALRFVAEPMVRVDRETWVPLGVLSGVLQALAVTLFVFNTGFTRHRTGKGLTWQTRFVFASLFWFMAVSISEPFAFANAHHVSQLQSILFVAKWYPALREAQFLGFVAMMIFGVALVKMHSCFGAREADGQYGRAAFVLWMVGLGLRMYGWIFAFDHQFVEGSQIMYFLGGFILTVAAIFVVISLGIFEKLEMPLRSHKFIRAAFGWLIVTGALMCFEPFHLHQIGMPFSHAFTGAVRHAVTVGFISQMILGVGAHVVSRMNDLDESKLPSLWSVFILLNLGNLGRVALEVASDYSPLAFRPMGFTGFIELTGLTIWAYHVARSMLVSMRTRVVYAK